MQCQLRNWRNLLLAVWAPRRLSSPCNPPRILPLHPPKSILRVVWIASLPIQKNQENTDDPEYRRVSGCTTGSPACIDTSGLDPHGGSSQRDCVDDAKPERRRRRHVPLVVGHHDRPFGGERPGQENARLDHRGTYSRSEEHTS